jgi:hypothetical protein
MYYRLTRAERHARKQRQTEHRQSGYTEAERFYYANFHRWPNDPPDDYDADDWERDDAEDEWERADAEDEWERAMSECGMMADGYCSAAGSEYCDWDCPFSRETESVEER